MADYQSSFSGEEIDDILAKAKSGDFTVQSDYAQNDSTQSDYIKNRPVYAKDEQHHTVVWDVEGVDYDYYRCGDIAPSVDDNYTLIVNINSFLSFGDVSAVGSNATETLRTENDAVCNLFIEKTNGEAVIDIKFSEVDGKLPGIYVAGLAAFKDFCTGVEVIYSSKKALGTDYISSNVITNIVIDAPDDWLSSDAPTDIPLNKPTVAALTGLTYIPKSADIFIRFSTEEEKVVPVQYRGLGYISVFLEGNEYLYSLNATNEALALVGVKLFNDTETTTYGLRKLSLDDIINASLEERGLNKENLLSSANDLTNLLDNEVTE